MTDQSPATTCPTSPGLRCGGGDASAAEVPIASGQQTQTAQVSLVVRPRAGWVKYG